MILTRDGKEIAAIYRQDGSEVEDVKDANGRIVYLATREITGTLPLSFSGRGKPLTDYLISGNTIQDGTPAPEAPVDVVGCGVRTENLFDKSATDTNNGYITNGYLTLDGSVNPGSAHRVSEYIAVLPNQSYSLYYGGRLGTSSACFYDSSKNFISGIAYEGRRIVPFTTPQNATFLRFSFMKINEDVAMLNLGSTVLPYEPYGFKLPLTVNGTEYPIYLGQVPTTRRIKKLVLDGTEPTWQEWSNLNLFRVPDTSLDYQWQKDGAICDSLPLVPRGDLTTNTFCWSAGTVGELIININNYNLAELKSYLSSNPVTVWYVLAEPKTGIVNEPLHKIGDYGDTISFAQAGVTIHTVSGANVLDMTSTVTPSEVYIKGKGIKQNGG